jgi:hypothetical protein
MNGGKTKRHVRINGIMPGCARARLAIERTSSLPTYSLLCNHTYASFQLIDMLIRTGSIVLSVAFSILLKA